MREKEMGHTDRGASKEEVGRFRELYEVEHSHNKLAQPPYFIAYKSAEEKKNFTKSLRSSKIRPFLTAYFKKYEKEIASVIKEESPEIFLENLIHAWKEVKKINQEIDEMLYAMHKSPFGDLSLEEAVKGIALLRSALLAEHKKNIYSGGIKKKVEKHQKELTDKYMLSQDDARLLITPGFETFFEEYERDHAMAFLTGGDRREIVMLARKYHGGDEALCELRLKDFQYDKRDRKKLEESLKKNLLNLEERFIKKCYLLMERPDARILEDILAFDNKTEYEYVYEMAAYPELFLRQRLLDEMKERKIVPQDAEIFHYLDDEAFLRLTDCLLEKMKKKMRIRLRPYRQTDNTCGTACVMSVLNRVGIPLSTSVEMSIWDRVGKPYNFPGGMGRELIKYGFHVKYVQDSAKVFDKSHPDIKENNPELLQFADKYLDLHDRAVAEGMDVEISEWGTERIVSEIQLGNVCIIGVNIGGKRDEVLHWITARGYEKKGYGYRIEILDPLGIIKWVDNKDFEKMTQTSMGRRVIIVKKYP